MKASIIAVAAAMVAGVSAGGAHGHSHAKFHEARGKHNETAPAPSNGTDPCACYTVWQYEWEGKTYTVPSPTPSSVVVETKSIPVVSTTKVSSTSTTTSKTTVYSTSTVVPTTKVFSTYAPPIVQPTPIVTTCPTPGTYSFPATTVTITESTTVCGATTTKVPAGPVTYGGVTTVVVEATTVVCPYATVVTSTGVVTSTILSTTYVCPSAGTYTPVPPTTTTVTTETVIVYPVPKTYGPGTYTAPATVVTATVTDFVYYCPLESSTWVPAATPPPAPIVSVSVPAPSSPAKSGESAKMGANGDKWAITYTPYNQDAAGGCKSRDEVFADLASVAKMGFTAVRIYSTDCSALPNVGDGCAAAGLKLIVGVFIDGAGIGKAQSQVSDLVAFSHWDLVELCVIGNEAVFNGFASAPELMAFVASSKAAFKAAGYNGPVTITEPLNIWQANAGTFCDGVDIVGSTMHPFFNSDVTAAGAGAFAAAQLGLAATLCPGKGALNLEIGWPSAGNCNGAACPGADAQKTAISGILSATGSKAVIFSFGNDAWKAPGQFDCEQYWGVSHLF